MKEAHAALRKGRRRAGRPAELAAHQDASDHRDTDFRLDPDGAGEAVLAALVALRRGDASVRLPKEWPGRAGRIAEAFNDVVELNVRLAQELARLSRVVGREGKLKHRASIPEVEGFWHDSVENINSLIDDLVHPTTEVARVIGAFAQGDLSQTIALEVDGRPLEGEFLTMAKTINRMVEQLGTFSAEVTRVAREIGTEGKLGGRVTVTGVAGTWKELTESVNSMAGNVTSQVRSIAEVTKAVAAGDLSKKIALDVKGEILELKNTVNTMVDQLSSFAAEVTRVAREVGTEGILGGQARVEGVSGTWKDLTDNVNVMASNLTSQVRNIAKVVTAVANGDLKQKLKVEAKGEIAALAETINGMTDTLATFADQVTTVAREVGVEGKLGGQAKVPGASGTWKALTENVNQLAANLTTQVRAIAEVATAVTQGDLTRSITVQAQGEVAALKDTINEMIRNLKDTTQKNTEQDWLKTNLAKFSRMLQGQKDLVTVSQMILSELAPVVGAQQAEFYVLDTSRPPPRLKLLASYASGGHGAHGKELALGEGLVGQCAVDKRKILMTGVPVESIRISSSLLHGLPRSVLVLPVIFEGELKGVMELASFDRFSSTHQAFLDQLTESIGIVINTIESNMRTENLLKQSQSLAQELQQTNQELQQKARLLAHQNQEVERKNREVEQARQAVEEKAKQLALTSKYKSEFLANMSHELRTPLNSLLILSDQLSRNAEGNLLPRQVEYARTIHSAGNDLLMLINDILDLSKIESGTVVVDVSDVRLEELKHYVERNFRPIAEAKGVEFAARLHDEVPRSVLTDPKRLQQILRNLLSNAFKFTHRGHVTLTIEPARGGWSEDNEVLCRAHEVIAFSVEDTGIGIPPDKQQIIFEAFQQADGSTSRKYGGTGLGLAISRELSKLLGGEICLASTPRKGSVFTLYLPQTYAAPHAPRNRLSSLSSADAGTRAATVQIQHPAPLAPVSVPAPAESLEEEQALLVNEAHDDRDVIRPGDRVLLIVENDLAFSRFLLDTAREQGFRGLVTPFGTGALVLTRDFNPAAITLDLHVPDMDGWRVLSRLKNDLSTRHIPVYVISTDERGSRALDAGAAGFLTKPVRSKEELVCVLRAIQLVNAPESARLLLLMPESEERERLVELLSGDDVRTFASADGALAPEILREHAIDCVILDPRAANLTAGNLELLDRESTGLRRPLVIFYGTQCAAARDEVRARLGDRITLRDAQTTAQIVDLVAWFLHRNVARLPEAARREIGTLHESQKVLAGKKALVVDDDMRNIFALATVLDAHGMRVVSADNGREAIEHVMRDPDIDIVLMDIMMPEIDGIATIQEIRRIPERRDLPIIAVTAKAMKGDREKCIAAGAWDYLSKPVDTRDLLAVLGAWLER